MFSAYSFSYVLLCSRSASGRRRARARRAARRPSACRGPGRVRPARQRARRAHRLPHVDRPEPDQLAEHLADLGRGDEVAAAPKGSRVGSSRAADRPRQAAM